MSPALVVRSWRWNIALAFLVLKSLLERKVAKDNIYMSLERRMKCGIGKCGHCQMEGVYVCQEGPVFNYVDIEHNEEAL